MKLFLRPFQYQYNRYHHSSGAQEDLLYNGMKGRPEATIKYNRIDLSIVGHIEMWMGTWFSLCAQRLPRSLYLKTIWWQTRTNSFWPAWGWQQAISRRWRWRTRTRHIHMWNGDETTPSINWIISCRTRLLLFPLQPLLVQPSTHQARPDYHVHWPCVVSLWLSISALIRDWDWLFYPISSQRMG